MTKANSLTNGLQKLKNNYIVLAGKIAILTATNCYGSIENVHNKSQFTILKIENKGFDIGSKFVMMNYLNTQHSSCGKREKRFLKLIHLLLIVQTIMVTKIKWKIIVSISHI